MSESRPSTKRSLESSTPPMPNSRHSITSTTLATQPPSNKRSRMMDLFSQHQIETLQAELEHERNLRSMEEQRFQQAKKRLEKQVELAVDQAQEAQGNLSQFQQESERVIMELRQTRNNALEELRKTQLELDDQCAEKDEETFSASAWEEKCQYLEQRLATYENEEMKWKEQLKDMQTEMEELVRKEPAPSPQKPLPAFDDAPPAAMKELYRVRIQLAESERKERQALRKIADLEHRSKTLLQEREEARTASSRLIQVEMKFKEIQLAYDTLVAKSSAWKQFEHQMVAVIKRQNIALCHEDGPPEISTILRYMEQVQSQFETTRTESKRREDECNRLRESSESLSAQLRQLETLVKRQQDEKKELGISLQSSNQKLGELRSKEAVYAQEIASLRLLIKTFDDMPLVPDSGSADDLLSSPKLNTSLKTLQVSLEACQRNLALVAHERDSLLNQIQLSAKMQNEQKQELARISDKFERLKEALYTERSKVERAEARANQAEALSGKGAFNPDTTRVFSLSDSPLTEALKEEIKVLRRQLELAGEKGKQKLTSSHDPDKLNQRLKENFKEQIALFREGVYIMTGLKVDMLPVTGDRPTFRVRSIFAEQEQDHLMLKWPAGEEHVKSLDILNTDFAKALSQTDSYQYMTKFHSLPAFLASVQLSLFEKQTLMM